MLRAHSIGWATLAALLLSSCAHPAACTAPGCAGEDGPLRAQVLEQLNKRPSLRFDNIDVQVYGHDVYLYGMVDTKSELDSAGDIAQAVPGVHRVYNALGLQSNGW